MQGDWGTQFGMLIQYIAEKREGGLNASTEEDVADLQVRVGASGSASCFCPLTLQLGSMLWFVACRVSPSLVLRPQP